MLWHAWGVDRVAVVVRLTASATTLVRWPGNGVLRIARDILFAGSFISAIISCQRRVPGTCVEDIDCVPGFDCRAGACVRRERLYLEPGPRNLVPLKEPPSNQGNAVPAIDAQPPTAMPDAGGGAPKHDRTLPNPPILPSDPLPPERSPRHEPIWKQRLKNS